MGESDCQLKGQSEVPSVAPIAFHTDGWLPRPKPASAEFIGGCVSVSADLLSISISLARPLFGVDAVLAMNLIHQSTLRVPELIGVFIAQVPSSNTVPVR